MNPQATVFRASRLVALLLAVAAASCSDEHHEDDTDLATSPQTFILDRDASFEDGPEFYDWQTANTVVRMDLNIDDYYSGRLWLQVFDARGTLVLNNVYGDDDYWIVGGGDIFHVDYTSSAGLPGLWTVVLDFDDFSGDISLTLVSSLP